MHTFKKIRIDNVIKNELLKKKKVLIQKMCEKHEYSSWLRSAKYGVYYFVDLFSYSYNNTCVATLGNQKTRKKRKFTEYDFTLNQFRFFIVIQRE